jgi:hypothetical protein
MAEMGKYGPVKPRTAAYGWNIIARVKPGGADKMGCTLPLRHTSMEKAGDEQFFELAWRSVAER